MSLADPQARGRDPPPGLSLNLSSNNPFRARAASPALPSPQSKGFPADKASSGGDASRNPFLDRSDTTDMSSSRQRPPSPVKVVSPVNRDMSPSKAGFTSSTTELFNNLQITGNAGSAHVRQAMPPPSSAYRSPRPENMPLPTNGRSGPGHFHSHSQEEEMRLRTGAKARVPTGGLDIFADPPEYGRLPEVRRPRRNSDSSLVDKSGTLTVPNEDRRRRERRHREREARHRDAKGRLPPSAGSKSKKPNQRLDIIDKLDVTSIYGTGLFHHDGPFDACNPHRNRKDAQRAPMHAFPKDSTNNAIGGSGPVNKSIDIAQFHGQTPQGFTDYATSAVNNSAVEPVSYESYAGASSPLRQGRGVRTGIDRTSTFNPIDRVAPVHGDETLGLGTSTFLEGAPAPRAAIQRRESESDAGGFAGGFGGGLGRKRSLVQKIRAFNRPNSGDGRVASPEARYERTTSPTEHAGYPASAGGMSKIRETNPFFGDYDDAYEKKGARIQIVEDQNRGSARVRAPSDPRRLLGGVLERRTTNDGTGMGGEEIKSGGGGGFISRVKSLRGGRRERRE